MRAATASLLVALTAPALGAAPGPEGARRLLEQITRRQGRTVECRPFSPTGRVIDLHGAPVADALISLRVWRWETTPITTTRTDADGRFRLPSPLPDPGWIEAEGVGLRGDGRSTQRNCGIEAPLVLHRDLPALAAALDGADTPEARLWLAVELAALGGPATEDLPLTLPMIGALLPELRALAALDAPGEPLVDQARTLLFNWGDGADAELWQGDYQDPARAARIGLARPDLRLLVGELTRLEHQGRVAVWEGPFDGGPAFAFAEEGRRLIWSASVFDQPYMGQELRFVIQEVAGAWMVVQVTEGASIMPSYDGY